MKYKDPAEKMSDKAFVIADSLGKHSKFSAKTPCLAQAWVDKIRSVISQEKDQVRQEVLHGILSFARSYMYKRILLSFLVM